MRLRYWMQDAGTVVLLGLLVAAGLVLVVGRGVAIAAMRCWPVLLAGLVLGAVLHWAGR